MNIIKNKIQNYINYIPSSQFFPDLINYLTLNKIFCIFNITN